MWGGGGWATPQKESEGAEAPPALSTSAAYDLPRNQYSYLQNSFSWYQNHIYLPW